MLARKAEVRFASGERLHGQLSTGWRRPAIALMIRAEKIPANTEIPDRHYIPMRLRDWFAPVTVIALEACIFQ
jgi:hypothetical protein